MIGVSSAAPIDRLQPQHRADDRGMAARERLHQALQLGDVALEARAQRGAAARASSVKNAGAPGAEP